MHLRAEFPPDAAKTWLIRTCETPEMCDLGYIAGFDYIRIQSEPIQGEPWRCSTKPLDS